VDSNYFEAWMIRILEKLESLERKINGNEKVRHTIDGETLLDNQDVCFMLNISKRTLQRFRSSGSLPYNRINQKLYYLESDVLKFIKKHLKRGNKYKDTPEK
jgi:ribosome-associated translation inhibitor RaiA